MEKIIALEAHNGLSALLVEKSKFDAIWVSSLTQSTSKGLPDNELVTLNERLDLVHEIRKVAKKPILVDIDTGGNLEHIPYFIRAFRDAGVYAVVIEDKKYPKQNSLLSDGKHQLEDVDIFTEKILLAKKNSGEMKVIARLESLIAKRSMEEALIRAVAYVEANADVILIHSKQKIDASEVMEFAKRFRKMFTLPLMAIPSTYTLPKDNPFSIIVYANQMMRASFAAMKLYSSKKDVDIADVEEIFELLGH